jgi:hypothetical protein
VDETMQIWEYFQALMMGREGDLGSFEHQE